MHTRRALEDYLLRGYEPGSFLTSVLSNNFVGAVTRADSENGKHLKEIAIWIVNNIPVGSWGNEERVYNWCKDKDGARTEYATSIEQIYMWNKLKEPTNG